MAFKWMRFSIKENASTLGKSRGLSNLLKLDSDAYSQLGTVAVDRAYASYRASYKAFKNELKQAQAALVKLMAEQQKTIDALTALDGRVQGVDKQLMLELSGGGKVRRMDGPDEVKKQKDMITHVYDFSGDVSILRQTEDNIQANLKELMVFLAGSKRAQE